MTFVYILSMAAFMLKGQELSVVIKTVWLAELKIFTAWPFNRKSMMAPALALRHEQKVYLGEGHDSMVVKNVGSRIRRTHACILAPPLPCCKTFHIIYLSESVFSPAKGR